MTPAYFLVRAASEGDGCRQPSWSRRASGAVAAAFTIRGRPSPGPCGPRWFRCWSASPGCLAVAYRRNLRTAATLAGVEPQVVHVVGGGSENRLLCQLTADACGLRVVAGPKEAAALGNVLVQARALGVEMPTMTDMRALVRATQSLTRYEPR